MPKRTGTMFQPKPEMSVVLPDVYHQKYASCMAVYVKNSQQFSFMIEHCICAVDGTPSHIEYVEHSIDLGEPSLYLDGSSSGQMSKDIYFNVKYFDDKERFETRIEDLERVTYQLVSVSQVETQRVDDFLTDTTDWFNKYKPTLYCCVAGDVAGKAKEHGFDFSLSTPKENIPCCPPCNIL